MKMQTLIKKIITIAFFFLSIFIGIFVSFIALQQDITLFNFETFLEASADWVERYPAMLVAFLMILIVFLTSGIRIHLLMRVKRKRTRFLDSLIYGILARYYVLITPWGLGGQPITIALMLKKNIPFGLATAIPMIDLLLMRLAMTFIGAFALIRYGHLVDNYILFFSILGYFITSVLPILIILFTFNASFEKLILQLIDQYWPPKTKEKTIKNLQRFIQNYRLSFQIFKQNPWTLIQIFVYSFVSQLALVSIPYFVMLSFNFSPSMTDLPIAFTFTHVTAMVIIATFILGTIPTIGSAGAAEFTFVSVFSIFLSGNYLFWTTFIWRFFVFYLWLVVGVFITTFQGVFAKREKKRHHVPNPDLPLKIFLFHDYFYPKVDESVIALDAYAKYLTEQGHDVTVVAPFSGNKANFIYRVFPIQVLQFLSSFDRFPYQFFRRKYQNHFYSDSPTIYHTFSPFRLGSFVAKMARNHNVPLITTLFSRHQDLYVLDPDAKHRSLSRQLHVLRHSESILFSDPMLKRHSDGGKFAPEKWIQLPHGTSFSLDKDWLYKRKLIRKKLALSELNVTLLVDIHLYQAEPLEYLRRTIEDFDLTGKPFTLLILGTGIHEKKLKTELVSKQENSRIIFLGHVTDSLVRSGYFSAADWLLLLTNPLAISPLIQEAAAHQLFVAVPYSPVPINPLNNLRFVYQLEAQSLSFIDLIQREFPRKLVLTKEDYLKAFLSWPQTLHPLVKLYEKTVKEFYQFK